METRSGFARREIVALMARTCLVFSSEFAQRIDSEPPAFSAIYSLVRSALTANCHFSSGASLGVIRSPVRKALRKKKLNNNIFAVSTRILVLIYSIPDETLSLFSFRYVYD